MCIRDRPGEESLDEIEKINSLPYLNIQGMFTHFACADMRDKTHVKGQIEKFHRMIEGVKARGVSVEIFHCSNSASIMELESEHMNMVRAGIILYGLYPSHEMEEERLPLKPVMSLYSHIAVSYTHLDVYKRQRLQAAVQNAFCRKKFQCNTCGYPCGWSAQKRRNLQYL